MGVFDTLKSNAQTRVDNAKSFASREVSAGQEAVQDLMDLEVVEAPVDLTNNTLDNVGDALKNMASANKKLFDGLERDIAGGEFELGEKIKRKVR